MDSEDIGVKTKTVFIGRSKKVGKFGVPIISALTPSRILYFIVRFGSVNRIL